MLVPIVTFLRFVERFLLHFDVFARLDGIPVVVDDLKEEVVYLGFEGGARLRDASLRDDNGSAIHEPAASFQERLNNIERKARGKGRTEKEERAVRGEFV